jgi:hypothetical protein
MTPRQRRRLIDSVATFRQAASEPPAPTVTQTITKPGTREISDGAIIPEPLIAIGFNDRLANRPYPSAYETWSEPEQRRYENGRLVASNMLLLGVKLKPLGVRRWRGYSALYYQSIARFGTWRPTGDPKADEVLNLTAQMMVASQTAHGPLDDLL